MTPLKIQSVYVAVDVNDELPISDSKILAKPEVGPYRITNGFHIKANRSTHWLKEQSGYLLSQEEMERLIGEVWEAAKDHANAEEYGVVPNRFPDKQTFINSLIKR